MSSPLPKPSNQHESSLPWYRQFWAWFVLAPLIVVVCVSSYTISLAVLEPEDRVIDNYYKEGRLINARLNEDIRASELGLVANIKFDQSVAELVINLEGSMETFPNELVLEFSHVSRQDLDHQVTLRHIAKGQYLAELGKLLQYRWYLRLRPVSSSTAAVTTESTGLSEVDPYLQQFSEGHQWRLRGEIDFSKQSSMRLLSKL